MREFKELNFFLLVHTGEGSGSDDCAFEDVDITAGENLRRYITCRNTLEELALSLNLIGMKAVFQFHGGFFQHLIEDDSFSFDDHILDFGHEVGIHHHTQCLIGDSYPGV